MKFEANVNIQQNAQETIRCQFIFLDIFYSEWQMIGHDFPA
jgi:hypothetical protein